MSWTLARASESLKQGRVLDACRFLTYGLSEKHFERRYGIRSSGVVTAASLGADPSVSKAYEATSYRLLHRIFQRIAPRRLEDNEAFLDAGCGMGRAVIVAASRPYRAIYGVEISTELVQAARANVAASKAPRRCAKVEVIAGDVSSFQIPDEVTTIFMFNPFVGQALDRFMENLKASIASAPRKFRLVFVNPEHFDASAHPWLERRETFSVFQPTHRSSTTETHIYAARPGLRI